MYKLTLTLYLLRFRFSFKYGHTTEHRAWHLINPLTPYSVNTGGCLLTL